MVAAATLPASMVVGSIAVVLSAAALVPAFAASKADSIRATVRTAITRTATTDRYGLIRTTWARANLPGLLGGGGGRRGSDGRVRLVSGRALESPTSPGPLRP